MPPARLYLLFFFFNDPATTEIYTLSLHDALPILNTTFGKSTNDRYGARNMAKPVNFYCSAPTAQSVHLRSEEHTSELQSPDHLVCRLLLEKKNKSYIGARLICGIETRTNPRPATT